jgi:hypothetical protein
VTASGVAIETLAGNEVEKVAAPVSKIAPKVQAEEDLTRLSGSLAHVATGERSAQRAPPLARGRKPSRRMERAWQFGRCAAVERA